MAEDSEFKRFSVNGRVVEPMREVPVGGFGSSDSSKTVSKETALDKGRVATVAGAFSIVVGM